MIDFGIDIHIPLKNSSRMCAARCDRGFLGDSPVSCKLNSDDFPFFKAKIGPTQPDENLNHQLT